MENVEEALRVLYTTTNPSLRRSADKWLQDFQASDAAWELATNLISAGGSAESRLFGCTVLCNKLRGGNLGGLPPESATSLRTALLQRLASLSGEYGALVANVEPQLCRAIQGLAIDSLHAYAKHADVFVILAPKITHADKGTPCDYTSYQGRMYASRPPTSPSFSDPFRPSRPTPAPASPFCRDVPNPGGVARSSCATP